VRLREAASQTGPVARGPADVRMSFLVWDVSNNKHLLTLSKRLIAGAWLSTMSENISN
jgi:hypothetical protein